MARQHLVASIIHFRFYPLSFCRRQAASRKLLPLPLLPPVPLQRAKAAFGALPYETPPLLPVPPQSPTNGPPRSAEDVEPEGTCPRPDCHTKTPQSGPAPSAEYARSEERRVGKECRWRGSARQ